MTAAAALLLGALASAAAATPEAEESGLPAALREEAATRALSFDERALRFRCLESTRRARYGGGQARRERSFRRQYLLIREEDGTFYRGLRRRADGTGSWKERRPHPFPEPLAWTQMFRPAVRERFRFEADDPATTPWRLARPVRFQASGVVDRGLRIDEWSGTAWLEVNTGNLVRLVARPNFQDRRIVAEYHRWITAFSFLGIHLAKVPRGYEIQVDFDEGHEGFLYPNRVELRTFRMVAPHRNVTESRTVIAYRDYEFFRSDAEDRIPAAGQPSSGGSGGASGGSGM